ncbi:hypothetical protein B0T18DRAFT_386010 [Schizothecium vesticola]|uniref:Uncharacterized protein n=1 Tax=Schizothecium vesticola TaxID=314040 RepID=A0AA40KCR6_9PEZI|nr:hypothetical protein B0T18DRAFT_386010 [Schizothecium vesticola]
MDMCSSDAQWWSCSFDNQFYTGCCTVNACHQTPVGCPTTPPTITTTVTTTSLNDPFTFPHLIETRSLASAPAETGTGTSDLSMTQPLVRSSTATAMTTAPSFNSPSTTGLLTSAVHLHNESTSASPDSPMPSGVTVDATASPWSDHSMPRPAIVVLALVCVLLGILGSIMVWQGWKRRRERMKPSSSSSHPSPGDDDSAAGQEQQEMGEHFNVLVNPEAFPFTPPRSGAGPGHGKSSGTSFDSTARPVSAASMRPARYTNASPTLGDMSGGPVHDARYTNASPTLGETDGGPSTYARGMGVSPTLEEHDGRPFGSETHIFPSPPTMGRVLTPCTEGERNERLSSVFGTSPRVAGSSLWVNIWADDDDGQPKGGKKP